MKLVRPIDKRDQDVGVDEDSDLRRRGAPAANPLAECLGKCTTIVSVEAPRRGAGFLASAQPEICVRNFPIPHHHVDVTSNSHGLK